MTTFQVNRRLLTVGAVLTGSGALLALVGTVMAGAALATAGRGWMRSWDVQPSERAGRTLRQVKTASQAGVEAWRSEAG